VNLTPRIKGEIKKKHPEDIDFVGLKPGNGDYFAVVFWLWGYAYTNENGKFLVEFTLNSEERAAEIIGEYSKHDIVVLRRMRGKDIVVYAKRAQTCIDILASVMGGSELFFELLDKFSVFEQWNNCTRVSNGVAGNVDRAAIASAKQMSAIEKIKAAGALEGLPLPLKEAAELRFNNPSATVPELVELSGNKLTQSAFNHRMRKIAVVAQGL
jgi:DNA-binding protein WhiA